MEETKEDRVEYKIYQIVCNETGEVYIGKTIQTLEERLWYHKYHLTCTSRQIILRNKYRIEQIDSTFDEEESVKLERRYIETYECVNKKIPGRTNKEYREDNREEIAEKKKDYYQENREKFLEKRKEYYQENRDKILERQKEWREEHKEEVSKERKIKYTCECGSTLTIHNKAPHEKTQKHINYINSKK